MRSQYATTNVNIQTRISYSPNGLSILLLISFEIVPLLSTVKPIDLIIYELDEKEGSIKKLEAYNGLPSDENELNERLGDGNELFAQLLEIQQNL